MTSRRLTSFALLVTMLLLAAVGCDLSGSDHSAKTAIPAGAGIPLSTHSHLSDGDAQPSPLAGISGLTGSATSQRGCTTRLISHNYSERSTKPSMFVLHYTVSPNRAGTSDVDGIRSFFDNPANEVSSNYVIDWEGNCLLIVPESKKPWTQGAFNSNSISIEFIATGSESQSDWASKGDAGLRKGALVVADSLKRNGIPLRYVDPVDCTPKAGVTDHNALECGNTHHDVSPNFPWTKFKRYLSAAYHGTCFKFLAKSGGKVLARSDKVGKDGRERRFKGFIRAKDDVLFRHVGGGVKLQQAKVAC